MEVAENTVTFPPVADASLSLTSPTRFFTSPFDHLYSASTIRHCIVLVYYFYCAAATVSCIILSCIFNMGCFPQY